MAPSNPPPGRQGQQRRGVPLPVTVPTIKKSTASKWRAAVLIGVHLVIVVHIAHWLITGSTFTPLEPSESMEFVKHRVVNAGLVLFALSIVATLVLGRWFCGWGCHLVALQDLCRWMLGKMKIKPKPARWGILGTVPLIAFVYMFLAPEVYRWVRHLDEPPAVSTHFMTGAFWATFPPLVPAILTFLSCGFVIVYFLGAKAFCTYGCPYGGVYGVVEQLAPWRIRVTDACRGCGHCTAVCTSNVRVHQEVRDYGMVVDPGCMKCTDCVSVCPNEALYFGVGRPALLAAGSARDAKHGVQLSWRQVIEGGLLPAAFMFAAFSLFMWFDANFDWRASLLLTMGSWFMALLFRGPGPGLRDSSPYEEALICIFFLVSMFIFRGLYGAVPFLFSLGLSAITAFLGITAVRLFRQANLSIHRWQLKRGGRLAPAGYGFVLLLLVVLLFGGHSGAVQYQRRIGQHYYQQAQPWFQEPSSSLTEAQLSVVQKARIHIERCDGLALIRDPYDQARLARLRLVQGQDGEYERHLRRAIAGAPHDGQLLLELGQYYASKNRFAEALEAYGESIERQPDQVQAYVHLGRDAAMVGRFPEARAAFEEALLRAPSNAHIHFNYGVCLSLEGDLQQAIAHFARAVALDPNFVAARENLAGAYCTVGRFPEGIAQYNEALKQNPNDAETHELIARAYLAVGDAAQAEMHLQRALELAPQRTSTRQLLDALRRNNLSSNRSIHLHRDAAAARIQRPAASQCPGCRSMGTAPVSTQQPISDGRARSQFVLSRNNPVSSAG